MVRAWGFEPQRIAAQEPKGDVTSGKDWIAPGFFNTGFLKLPFSVQLGKDTVRRRRRHLSACFFQLQRNHCQGLAVID